MKFTLPSSRHPSDRLHALLNSRYICQRCLTRFFVPYRRCPACHQFATIARLDETLRTLAKSEDELRTMLSRKPGPGGSARIRPQ